MNRKLFSKIFIVSVIFLVQAPARVFSEEPEDTFKDDTPVARRLLANQSLLVKAKAEWRALTQEQLTHPSEFTKKKLKDLQYKMKVLEDDADLLRSSLSNKRNANDYLKDFIRRRETPPKGAAPSINADKIIDLHERALKLVNENKLSDAAALYEEILFADPNNDEAYLLLGHTYLLLGKYEKAETAFAGAVQIDPHNMEEIIPFYQNITLQNPGDDKAYSNLGYACLILGHGPQAAQAFQDALSINPENTEARKGMKILIQKTNALNKTQSS